MPGLKAQSAIEFMLTYSWAIILLAIVVGALILYLILPKTIIPPSCIFSYGVTCEGINVGSNALIGTEINLVLVNSQQYDLENPYATVNIVNYGSASTYCTPTNVLSSGIMVCSMQVGGKVIPFGTQLYGTILLGSAVCLSGTAANCQKLQSLNYTGNFTTTSTGYTSSAPVSILLTKQSSSAAPGVPITLTANVKVFGVAARGGSITFNSFPSTGTLSPAEGVSDPTGNVITYYTNTAAGTYTITAAFGTISSSNTVTIT